MFPFFAATIVLVPPTPAQPVSLPALERVRSLVAAGVPRSDGALESAVKALVEEASLPALIDWKQVAGTWRVVGMHVDEQCLARNWPSRAPHCQLPIPSRVLTDC